VSVLEPSQFYRPGPSASVYDNTSSGLGTPPTWLAPVESGGVGRTHGFSSGMAADFFGTVAPQGYLFCDGSAIDRVTYADLYKVLGTTYGAGNGSTTFNLPDCRGRVLVGTGPNGDVNATGKNDGVAVASRTVRHGHTSSTLPTHTHPFTNPTYSFVYWPHEDSSNGGGGSTPYMRSDNDASGWHSIRYLDMPGGGSVGSGGGGTITVGPGGTPTDFPAYLVCNKIIKI
jgi:hypothetical protein